MTEATNYIPIYKSIKKQGVGNGNGAQYVQFPTFGGLPTDRQLQAQQEEMFPGSASSSLFIASCPPLSKPLIDAQTGLGQACSGTPFYAIC